MWRLGKRVFWMFYVPAAFGVLEFEDAEVK